MRSTHQAPSGNAAPLLAAARAASRDLPTPPGPVSVTNRAPASVVTIECNSARRPTNEVSSTGRWPNPGPRR
jgi:hypothetical protein